MSYYLHCMTSRVKFGSTAGDVRKLGSSLHTYTHIHVYTYVVQSLDELIVSRR